MRPKLLALALLFALLMPLTALAAPGMPGPEGPPAPDVPAVADLPAAPVAPVPVPVPAAPLPIAVVPAPSAVAVMPPVVPAAEPALWHNLGVQALAYLLPIAGSVLTALVAWLLLLLQRRLGLNIALERDSMLRRAIRAAIAGAEEWAARKAKISPATGPDGAAKAAWVLGVLTSQFPDVLPDDLKRMADEELGLMPGVGATGDRAIGVFPGMELVDSPAG